MKKIVLPLLLVLPFGMSTAQEHDSILLSETVIESFQRKTPILQSTTSSHPISEHQMKLNHPERLVESFNTVPGVKMEERSPGSYRLSLRGSTIRSPFGVRNVKLYWDDFILTDATGNSYLNLIEPQFISSIDVFKGPQGGEYGIETGGVAVLKTFKKEGLKASTGLGSFHQWHENIQWNKTLGKHHVQLGQSLYQSDGYRKQSAVKRKSIFLNDQWKYSKTNEFNLKLVYTDLDYETPGGLTLQQMESDRRQARLATPTLPSAEEQNSSIRNKTFLGGINHSWKIDSNWKNFALIQSSYTDFKNPFISNFEERQETNIQGRFYLDYEKQWRAWKINTRFGTEVGINKTKFRNFDNLSGYRGNPQKFDDLKTFQSFYYFNQQIAYANKWFVDASLNLNAMKLQWESFFPESELGEKKFKAHWLPQLGTTYKLNSNWSIRGKIAKGLSSPTTEEVRSSNQEIQQHLTAEYGWNKEMGIRYALNQWFFELTAFDYHLREAIVKRQDEAGNDYFVNSGGTKQRGLEWTIQSKKFHFNHPIFTKGSFFFSGHLYDFKYDHYQSGSNDFSNHLIPGVSKFSIQNNITIELWDQFHIIWSNYFNSKFYLNDANSIEEKDYLIGNFYVDSTFKFNELNLSIYAGIQNLYNAKYSAGYDLNAFGNRFYNPAATTNFYIGTRLTL